MQHLLGYLELQDDFGQCVELVNGARTLALMQEGCRAHTWWDQRDLSSLRRWNGNEVWAFDSGQYGETSALWDVPGGEQDPNPWEDPDDPRTQEVAGFLPDPPGNGIGLQLEAPTESRVMDSQRVEPLELIVTGTVVAGTARGEGRFLAWMKKVLTDPVGFKNGWRATVFTHEPDAADWLAIGDPLNMPPPPNGAPVYTTWDDPTPNLLEDWTDPTPWPLDSGLRQLFDVRFRSIDPLTDQPLFPHCVGRRYTLRFTVGAHYFYDRPRTLATLGGTGEWDIAEAYETPLDVNPVAEEDPCDTGPPGLAVPYTAARWSGLRTRQGRWSLPNAEMRLAVLTPPRPATLEDRLVLTVTNPSLTETVYNSRVRIWEAIVDVAPPNTQVGDEYYRNREPVSELRIVKLEPAESVIFDGRTGRAKLVQRGGRTVINNIAGRVEGPHGARIEGPTLRCNERYWVCAEMSTDPLSHGDLDLELTLQAAEQDIPT